MFNVYFYLVLVQLLCVSLTEIDIWLMVSFIKTHTHTHAYAAHPLGSCFFIWLFIWWRQGPTYLEWPMDRRTICPALLSPRLLPREVERDPANLSPGSPALHSGNKGDTWPLTAAVLLGTSLTSSVSLWPHNETTHQTEHPMPFLYVFIINRTHKTAWLPVYSRDTG